MWAPKSRSRRVKWFFVFVFQIKDGFACSPVNSATQKLLEISHSLPRNLAATWGVPCRHEIELIELMKISGLQHQFHSHYPQQLN